MYAIRQGLSKYNFLVPGKIMKMVVVTNYNRQKHNIYIIPIFVGVC